MSRQSLKNRGFLEKCEAENLQDFGEAPFELEFAFEDRHQHIDADRNPDLCLDRVRARPEKGFDSQMLLDPFEEQLHLPATFVQAGNGQGRQGEVVRQEHEPPFGLGIEGRDADVFVKGLYQAENRRLPSSDK